MGSDDDCFLEPGTINLFIFLEQQDCADYFTVHSATLLENLTNEVKAQITQNGVIDTKAQIPVPQDGKKQLPSKITSLSSRWVEGLDQQDWCGL